MTPTSRKLTFENRQGEELVARIDEPNAPLAYALLAHCFTCSKDLKGLYRLSQALVSRGLGVLRFDFTGLGESEGEFADTNFSSNVDDLVAAASFMSSLGKPPALLVGHSLGGAAILRAAADIPSTRAVVTIGAPASPVHVRSHFGEAEAILEEAGTAQVEVAGRSFTIKKQFVDDLDEHDMQRVISELRHPLLVLHSPLDEVVELREATRIFTAAKHPKSFVSLDAADHLLTRAEDATYAAEVIAAWSKRYLATEATIEAGEAAQSEPSAVPGRVVVHGPSQGFRTEIQVGSHRQLADEPRSYGGTETGPSPYDYLLAGLGACAVMTLRMYADRKGFPLERARIALRHGKIHARDCADCETRGDSKIDQIERELVLEGDQLTDEHKQALLALADRCPVHRTLQSEIKIRTRLVDGCGDE